MKKSEPLISIIIPVYNTARYLPKCLDSVVNQTYRNLEIILIDDGSTDTSGEICDSYAARDLRVVVIHKENEGVSQARNCGIEKACGDYLTFVDSDDWVDELMCEALFEALAKYGVQAAMCSYIREYPDKSLPKHVQQGDMVFSGRAVQRRLCGPVGEELKYPENLDCYNMMCGKLYPAATAKKKRVVDIKELGSSEDLLYNLEVFSEIESMAYIDLPYYHYRKSLDNSISTKYRDKLESQWDNLYFRMRKVMEEDQLNEDCIAGLNNRVALNVLGLGLNSVQDSAKLIEKCRRIKKVVARDERKTALNQLKLRYMPFHWKLFFFFAKYRFALLLCLLLIVITKLKGKV